MNFPSPYYKALCLGWIAFACLPTSAATPTSIGQACVPTPALAVRSARPAVPLADVSAGTGYRVSTYRWDPLLQQRWAMVMACGHPERPAIAVPVLTRDRAQSRHVESSPVSARLPQGLLPVVHAGDLVRLWSQDQTIRIEMSGIAEENAAMGRQVRVRVLPSNLADGGPPHILSGAVRGFRDVEIKR